MTNSIINDTEDIARIMQDLMLVIVEKLVLRIATSMFTNMASIYITRGLNTPIMVSASRALAARYLSLW